MKTTAAILMLSAVAVFVTGCEGARKALTQTKAAPDEFAVYRRAPLTLPPDYGLRPPAAPGTEIRPEDDTRLQARSAITGQSATENQVETASAGLALLYSKTGANSTDPNIRQLVNRETSIYAEEDTSVMENLMFGAEPGRTEALDPALEAKRLQESQALGQPLNQGDVPLIEKKSKGLLDGILN